MSSENVTFVCRAPSPRRRLHRFSRSLFTFACALAGALATSAGARDGMAGVGVVKDGVVEVGRFSPSSDTLPAPWQVIRFDEKIPATAYRTIRWEKVAAVEARADASMALLARGVEVDLNATPILCWRWRVDHALETADMRSKKGDDYAARVYVAFALPRDTISLATRAQLAIARGLYGAHVPDAAINYVWDNHQPIGTRLPNAYTDRTQMIVLRSGNREAKAWVSERRDVLADAVHAFGTDRARPSLLAIAADTDNTGERVRSGFADLHFVARDAPCEDFSDGG
jgi:hypothetical protein